MKQIILGKIGDLVSSFLYYDRKEDEDLSIAELKSAINNGIINSDEIVSEFKNELERQIKQI